MMNTPMQDYWQTIRRRKEELTAKHSDGAVYLYQFAGRMVVQTTIPVAAKAIVENTHREATKEEIEKFLSEQEAESRRLQAEQLRRSNPQLSLPPEITALLIQQQQSESGKGKAASK